MNRDNLFGHLGGAGGRSKTAAADAMGDLGRQVGGAYDQAAGAAEQAYGEARDAYHDALETAEQTYAQAREAAEEAYHDAQAKADALMAQGAQLYAEATKRGRDYGRRAARYAEDNRALALLLAGGVGFLLALAFKPRPTR